MFWRIVEWLLDMTPGEIMARRILEKNRHEAGLSRCGQCLALLYPNGLCKHDVTHQAKIVRAEFLIPVPRNWRDVYEL